MLAAIYEDDAEVFQCMLTKLAQRYAHVTKVYLEKAKLLENEYSEKYEAIKDPLYQICAIDYGAAIDVLNEVLSNEQNQIQLNNELDIINNRLQLDSCSPLY